MITFKNLPDTTTPINAENLNSNFSGLEEAKIIKSYRVSTQESGNQWKKIGVATFGGSDTYKIVGTSQVSNLNGRGHFELLISGESQNNASASLVYATNGITSDMFKVYASTDYKTIKVYFNSPQWTAYRMQVSLIRVYDGGVDSFEAFDTKETPAGDVEIPVKVFNDIYFTNEVIIGTVWNGQPLYRKVFYGNFTSSTQTDLLIGTIGDSTAVINIYGMTKDLNGYSWVIPSYYSVTSNIWVNCFYKNGDVYINGSSQFNNSPYSVTVEYIK